jgi:DNA processing protein
MNDQQRILLALALAEGVGPCTVALLRAAYSDLTELCAASQEVLVRRGLSVGRAQRVLAALASFDAADREYERCLKAGIRTITLDDAEYPASLKSCPYPAPVIWMRGVFPAAMRGVGIVGSRDATEYGFRSARGIVDTLAGQSVAIISGGARGIDTTAHEAALDKELPTVAVLGSGLLVPYPRENIPLFRAIEEAGGALVSPFSSMVRPMPGNFPARNHLIAAASELVVVIEAALKSGALITARAALDMGRDVAAVPGRVDDPLSAGCNELISQGAHIIGNFMHILRLLDIRAPEKAHQTSREQRDARSSDSLVMLCEKPQPFDALIAATGLSHDFLSQQLAERACAGLLTQDLFGRWIACV